MKLLISHFQVNCSYYLRHLNIFAVIGCFLLLLLLFLLITKAKKHFVTKTDCLILALSSLYISVVLSITILGREYSEGKAFANAKSSVQLLFEGNDIIFFDVLFNFLLFIPSGFLLSIKLKRVPSAFFVLLSSLVIEITQLVLKRGRFELIDIVTNSLGGIVGIGLFNLLKYISKVGKK